MMYIRYETNLTFKGTTCRKGIFAAMGDLKRLGKMSEHEYQWYMTTASWFNQNLTNPTCFERPIYDDIRLIAKSWFLNIPSTFLTKSIQVVGLLRKYDIDVKVLESENPGEIIYRDDFQIVTLPNNDWACQYYQPDEKY